MSLTNPNERAPRKKRFEALILVVFLLAVAIIRISLNNATPGEIAPLPSSTDSSSPLQPVVERSLESQSRSKLRDPISVDIPDATLKDPNGLLRSSAIHDQEMLTRILESLRQRGVDDLSLLIDAIESRDDVLVIGLSMALRNSPFQAYDEFDDALSALIRRNDSSAHLAAIESAGILGKPLPKSIDAIRASCYANDARTKMRSLTALRRLGDQSTSTYFAFLSAIHDPTTAVTIHALANLVQLVQTSSNSAWDLDLNLPGSSLPASRPGSPAPGPAEQTPLKQPSNTKIPSARPKPASNKLTTPIPSPAVARVLGEALKKGSSEVRAVAALRLAELRVADKSYLEDLGRLLRDPESKVRFAAGFALKNYGLLALPAISEACRDQDPLIRLNASLALSSLNVSAPEVKAFVAERFRSETDEAVLIQISLIMLRIEAENKRAVSIVIRELPFANSELRDRIVRSLKIASPAVVLAELKKAGQDPDGALRYESLQAMLSVFGVESSETQELIAIHAKDNDERVKRGALRADQTRRSSEPLF